MFWIFIILFFANTVANGKLKIHRCVLQNGTIAFQEKSCNQQKSKKSIPKNIKKPLMAKSPDRQMLSTQLKVKSRRVIPYKKIANVGGDDESTRLISDIVKTFKISISALSRWSMFKKVYNNKLLHIKFLDKQPEGKISLLIDFIFPDNKKFSDEELDDIVYLLGSQFVNSSVEGRVNTHKLAVKQGKGVMATFTNTNRNKEYRYTTKGVIYKGEWLIQFTLLSNNLRSFSHQFALQSLINSITIQKL